MKRISILLITVALIAGMVGCEPTLTYDLTIASTTGGNVTAPGEGVFIYDEGTAVNLTAEADECYRFVNWTGGVATVGNITAATTIITMNGTYSIMANFEEDTVVFPDANLEGAIREAIAKPDGPIYTCDLKGCTVLGAASRNISDLTGLEYCTNLTNLDLEGNEIANVSPLADLINLTRLDLKRNQIVNISPLADFINLTNLDLSHNEISSISAVGNLTNLTLLGFNHNYISDISAVTNLTNLTRMSLGDNQVVDISPLANLTSLISLDLWHNQISDISSLVNLTSLTYLYLPRNQISNISPLVDNEGLSAGDEVYLSGNPLSSDSIDIYIPQLQARGVTVYY